MDHDDCNRGLLPQPAERTHLVEPVFRGTADDDDDRIEHSALHQGGGLANVGLERDLAGSVAQERSDAASGILKRGDGKEVEHVETVGKCSDRWQAWQASCGRRRYAPDP